MVKRKSGGASRGWYGPPYERFHGISGGGHGRSLKLKGYLLQSLLTVDIASGGKEVVKSAKVLPTWLHPSKAVIEGKTT